jgi:hypothetical protein
MAEPPPSAPSAPWTTPAPPPPPAWTPGPPKRRRRRPWIWLLVGSVALILGLAVASGTLWITKVKAPIDAANDYLRDLSDTDYEAAFAQLCPAEQLDASPESLGRLDDLLLIDEYEVSPFDVNRDGSTATVKIELDPDTDGDVARLRLREIDGEWRPCGGRFGFVELPSFE